MTEFDSHPESRVRNSQPAGIGRVVDLGDVCAWNNLGRNVVFASRAFEPCAVFDQTEFPDDDEPSQYDLDVHAILDVPAAGVVVVLNHLGILRAFRQSEIRATDAPRRIEPVWSAGFAEDMERVVALGDLLIGSRPREQHGGGVLVSEPVSATADGGRLDARVELEAWGMVTALGTAHAGGWDCVAIGGNGRAMAASASSPSIAARSADLAGRSVSTSNRPRSLGTASFSGLPARSSVRPESVTTTGRSCAEAGSPRWTSPTGAQSSGAASRMTSHGGTGAPRW